MKMKVPKIAAIAVCFLLHSSVAESPPSDEGPVDPLARMVKNPAPSEVVATLAWGERAMFTNIQRQTTFIRRVATEAERRLAEQRAAEHYARLSHAQKAEMKKKKRYWAVPVTKRKPPATPRPKVPKREPEEEPKKEPIVAAETEDIMIYDPLAGSLVNKYVYTIKNMPPPDMAMSVDGYEPLLLVGR
jgi:hypothetical protein